MLKDAQVIDRENINRSFVSKNATGTQIMAGSLRMLGGLTVDGGLSVTGGLTISGAVSLGSNNLTTTGTITAGTFSGSGASLTNLPVNQFGTGRIATGNLPTTTFYTNTAQTITAHTTMSNAANLYFASGTTYYINTAGSAKFNALEATGIVTLDGNDYITFGSAGLGDPSDTSSGWKIKLYGNTYGFGVQSATVWYDSHTHHKFYTNSGGATRSERFQVNTSGIGVMGNIVGTNDLEVGGELKHGSLNEYDDPYMLADGPLPWGTPSNGTLEKDSVQVPIETGAVASLKFTAAAADAHSYHPYRHYVKPGEWITFSAYVFSTTAGNAAQLYIRFLKADGTYTATGSAVGASFTAPTSWDRFHVSAQAPSDARSAILRIDNDGGAGIIMFFSSFQVERGKARTAFQTYAGGRDSSLFSKGLMLPPSGSIYSTYNKDYLLRDHNNGNVTLSASGANLFLGYHNTAKVYLSTDLYNSNGNVKIADKSTGALYYTGEDLDTRYVNAVGDTMTGSLIIRHTGAGTGLDLRVPGEDQVDFRIGHDSYNYRFRFTGNETGNNNSLELWSYDADTVTNKVFRIQHDGIFRIEKTGATIAGNTIWHSGNDGAGSGLDADLLDGKSSSEFLDTNGSSVTIDVNSLSLGTKLYVGSSGSWTNRGPTGHNGSALFSMNTHSGQYYSQLWFDTQLNNFYHRTIDAGSIRSWAKVWTSSNHGSGSALDADLLDGLHADKFLRSDVSTGNTLLRFDSADGNGIRFWNNMTDYMIHMSASNNATLGGRLDATSDYNMYFTMGNGTNRGFVFRNKTTSVAQIDASGNIFANGKVKSGSMETTDLLVNGGRLTWSKGDGSGDWSIHADTEHFSLREKEDGDKEYIRIEDDGTMYLKSAGTTTMTLSASNDITVAGGITSTKDIRAEQNLTFSSPGTAYRENGRVNVLGRLTGRILNRNGDFISGDLTGYATYDNNSSGRVVLSVVADDTAPNSTGKMMRISYDPARNSTTSASPNYGGFKMAFGKDGTGNLTGWNYKAGNRYVYRIIANIPVGKKLVWNSNSTGTGGAVRWVNSEEGTGTWQEYIMVQSIGIGGTQSSTAYWSFSGGTDTAFSCDIASVEVIGVDEMPTVDRASNLNIGYKQTNLGWGELYTTGSITTDSSISATGAITTSNVLTVNGTGDSKIAGKLMLGGTGTPAYTLDVSGTARVSGNLYVSTGNANGSGIYLADDGSIVDNNDGFATMRFAYGVRITSAENGNSTVIQLANGAGTTAALKDIYFTTSGNFGIGTNTPAHKFHVKDGTTLFESGYGNLFTIKGTGTGYAGATMVKIENESTATTNKYLELKAGTSTFGEFSWDGTNLLIENPILSGGISTSSRFSAASVKVNSSFTDLTNNAPWYGIGYSNVTNATGHYVQVAGYWGLLFKTSGNEIRVNQTALSVTINGNRILTEADEGAGKGIDADQLDGQHKDYFMSAQVYHEFYTVGAGGLAALTPITIPNGRSYENDKLMVFRDRFVQYPTIDYQRPSATTVTFEYALPEGTELYFVINMKG